MLKTRYDMATDVIVIGTGAAGLSAALSARKVGAEVCILERSDKLGGTTAMSAGVAWVPCHSHMSKVGSTDTREAALVYLNTLSLGKTSEEMLETYVDNGPDVIDFLERETLLRFHALRMPDYHPEFAGATFGRSVIPNLISGKELGALRPALRMSPHFPIPYTLIDVDEAIATPPPPGEDFLSSPVLLERLENDMLGSGAALVAGLLRGALDAGADLRTEMRVRSLIVEDGTVTGVSVEHADATLRIGARRGVVLATGGFERNDALVQTFLRGPLEVSSGSPSNEGDGLRMAMEVGAELGNMSEAWWQPAAHIPGEEYDGLPFYRIVHFERTMPGAIMVNAAGRRFVNEAHNYNDIGRSFHSFDPVAFEFSNLPAWIILDHQRLDRYPILTRYPGDPVPNWLIQAPTLRELAVKIGIDADGLEATVKRFNENAVRGEDPDFHRGRSIYDRYNGDSSLEGSFKSLGPVQAAPFYALRIYSGCIGTKGGPKTNERAEVLSVRGGIIPGLYAAGNTMAGITGMAYPGGGGTIGPALVFGHIAGRAAASNSNRF